MNDKELTIFCPVWGQKFLDYLRDYTLPSLMLKGNLPDCGLQKIYVECVGVQDEHEHTVRVIAEGFSGLPVEIAQHACKSSPDIFNGLFPTMKLCRERGTRMLVVMPDTIYGPESISNIFHYAKGKPVTVAAAHVRTNEELWKQKCALWKLWPNNRDFVRNALEIGAFNICDTNKDNVASVGGVAWTQVNRNTKLLLHYLPTAYLAWFTESDIAWWSGNPGWSNWDHRWPELLVKERRWRVVGSTNIFFAIELEEAARSGQLKPLPHSQGNELYNGRHLHHDTNGCLLIEMTE